VTPCFIKRSWVSNERVLTVLRGLCAAFKEVGTRSVMSRDSSWVSESRSRRSSQFCSSFGMHPRYTAKLSFLRGTCLYDEAFVGST